MLVDTINKMLKELDSHRRSRDYLSSYYVQTRLTKSIQNYYADLLKAQASLENMDARKVLKEVTKEDTSVQS